MFIFSFSAGLRIVVNFSLVKVFTKKWSKCDTDRIERVQKYFTRMAFRRSKIKYTDYQERLKLMKLTTLAFRRTVSDLTMVHKIFSKETSINPDYFFSLLHSTRKHDFQIKTKFRNLNRESSFINRITITWNSLNRDLVNVNSSKEFKRKLIAYLGKL